MVQINKQMKKNRSKRTIKEIRFNIFRYVLGLPIYFILIKPLECIRSKFIGLREGYYKKRFCLLEEKVMNEIKVFAAERLSGVFNSFSLSEEVTYNRDADMCIKDFLKNSTYKYRKKGRKYSILYGKLFQDKIEEKHLEYMNDVVTWLLDQGCEVKYTGIWEWDHKVGVLIAEYKVE